MDSWFTVLLLCVQIGTAGVYFFHACFDLFTDMRRKPPPINVSSHSPCAPASPSVAVISIEQQEYSASSDEKS